MRLGRGLVIATVVIVLAVAAAVLLSFGSEPLVNGLPLRRYLVSTNSIDQPLARVGSEAIPWLIKGLEGEDSSVYRFKLRLWRLLPLKLQQAWSHRAPIQPRLLRLKCVTALERFGPEAAAAAPGLIEFAKSEPNWFPRAVAFSTLADMATDSPEAKAFLIESLSMGDGTMKKKIAGYFFNARFTPPEAVPLLIERLRNYVPPDEHSPVPINEMLALSVCGYEAAPAAPYLVKYLDSGATGDALMALRATGPAAVVALPRLLEILADGGARAFRLKPDVYAILARLGTNGIAALPALTNGLSDTNPSVRALAAAGIANITGDVKFAVPRLIDELDKSPSSMDAPRLRYYGPHLSFGLRHRPLAAVLLGELGAGATNALPNLKRALNTSDFRLSAFAAEAIWKISKDPNLVLHSLLADLKDPNPDRRMLTLNVLAQIGPAARPALPAIREAMQSDLRVRRYGYVALQKITNTSKPPP